MQLLCRQVDIGCNSCRDPDRTYGVRTARPMVTREGARIRRRPPHCAVLLRARFNGRRGGERALPFPSRNRYHCNAASPSPAFEKFLDSLSLSFIFAFPFFRRHSLRQHMLRHAGKKYKCGLPGCPTVLRTASELRSHVSLVHEATTSTRRYKCSDCSYAAKTRTQLRR